MTNANSKESTEKKFSGKASKGLTFEEFDLKVLSWGRIQYGNMYAKLLWENNLPDIYNLDLRDDLDHYVFEEHVSLSTMYWAMSLPNMQTPCTTLPSSGQ